MYVAQETQVSITDAAAAVGVTARSVRRWISSGRLQAKGEGHRRTVRLEEARRVRDASQAMRVVDARDETAELRGRYEELRDRVRELEAALAEERRLNGRLEARLQDAA